MPVVSPKQPSNKGRYRDLILLFAIPVVVALLAAGAVYLPSVFAKPKYDFVYSICNDYRCDDTYTVDSGGHLAYEYRPGNYGNGSRSTLWYYDAANDSTRSITLTEARKYQLNSSSKSPDGYSLSQANSNSGFLFWSDNDQGWYIKNGAKRKRIELPSGNSYSRDVQFIGWVNK